MKVIRLVLALLCALGVGVTSYAMNAEKDNALGVDNARQEFVLVSKPYNSFKRVELRVNGSRVGFVLYTPAENKISLLYVDRGHRKAGYGSRLLTYACNDCKKLGCTMVGLEPNPFEQTAHGGMQPLLKQEQKVQLKKLLGFYGSHGFQPCPSDEVLWTKSLK